MNDGEIRAAILEAAYAVMKEIGSKVGVPFALFRRSKDWGVEEKDINRNVDYLEKKGVIKKEGIKLVGSSVSPIIKITLVGVDEYESKHGRGDYGKYGCLADWNE